MNKVFVWVLTICMLLTVTTGCSKKDVPSGNSSVVSQEITSEDYDNPDTESNPMGDENSGDIEAPTASTGTENNKPSSKPSANTKPSTDQNDVKVIKDLKGYEFVIAWSTSGEQEFEYGVSEYMDAFLNSIKYVEKAYNCKITIIPYDYLGIYDTARVSIMSNDKFADVVLGTMYTSQKMYLNQLLTAASNLPDIKLSSDVWNKAVVQSSTFRDGVWYLGSNYLTPQQTGSMIHYNKTLLKKLQLEDPADLVKQGKWTWDKFAEMLKAARKDLNNDGKYGEKDRYGASCAAYDGLYPFFFSSGAKAITMGADKKMTYTLGSEQSLTKCQKFYDLMKTDGYLYRSTDAKANEEKYFAGESLFHIAQASSGKGIDEFDGEDAIVPVPEYQKGSGYVSAVDHNLMIWSFPRNLSNKTATGTIFQALADACKKNDTYNKYIEGDVAPTFANESSVEMLTKYIAPNMYIDQMCYFYSFDLSIYNGTVCAICNAYYTNGAQTAADMTGGYGEAIQKTLDEMMNK